MNVAVLVALVTGGCAILAATTGALINLRAKRRPRQRVEIEDAASTTPTPGRTEAEPANSHTLGIEFDDVDVCDPGYALDHPVVDVKFVNKGGQPAYLTRLTVEVMWAKSFPVLEDLLPYADSSGPLMLPPSATYDVDLPDPAVAPGKQIAVGISQSIAGGENDRVHVRLRTKFEHSSTSIYSQPAATSVYVLTLGFTHQNGKRTLKSRPVAAACPGNILYVPTVDGLKRNIQRFQVELESSRAGIDREMARLHRPPVDWKSTGDLRALVPEELPALKRLNENFWNPTKAIDSYLTRASDICDDLIGSLTADMPDGLGGAVALARETAQCIPELRRTLV